MFKKILKWGLIIPICLFTVLVVFELFNPQPKTESLVVADQTTANFVSTSTADVAIKSDTTSTQSSAVSTKTGNQVPTQPQKQTSPTPEPTKTTQQPAASQYTYYSVTKVVDGDTIAINLNGTTETLRLIGINTPETVDPRKPVECFGKEASTEAKTLLTGKRVRIEKDPSQGDRDKYGRLLAYMWREDGLFFNEHMIQQGYAHEYTYNTPYKYQTQFKADQASAKAQNKGLWAPGACDSTPTSSSATTATPTATRSSGHTFYLSTYYTSKYYYCDTDEVWKSLSSGYLKSYPSEKDLLVAYPSRTLHEACK